MPKVFIRPSGEEVEIDTETNLLDALVEKGVYVKSSCGGHASCSDCVIKIISGEDNLTPPPFEEIQLLGNVFHITKERLGCQTKITGDITVDLSKHDKETDQENLKKKTSNFVRKNTKVRKQDDVKKMYSERKEKSQEIQKEREAEWQKHWEKDGDNTRSVAKRLGGGNRPEAFNVPEDLTEETNQELIEKRKEMEKEWKAKDRAKANEKKKPNNE